MSKSKKRIEVLQPIVKSTEDNVAFEKLLCQNMLLAILIISVRTLSAACGNLNRSALHMPADTCVVTTPSLVSPEGC